MLTARALTPHRLKQGCEQEANDDGIHAWSAAATATTARRS
jgi:hypothetical protein